MSVFRLGSLSDKWFHTQLVSVKGYVYNTNNELLENEQLAKYFAVQNEKEWQERLKQSNGLFAVICHTPSFAAAAVDSSRIYPLYFRQDGDDYIFSDNAYTLLQPNDNIDELALEEYEASGAPFAGKTLVEQIHEINPGYYLFQDGIQKQFSRYAVCKQEICVHTYAEMQEMLKRVSHRLIHRIRNRQVVVPLSGGNDSRLILCMLKQLGYENVLCYTVGRPGNCEEDIAEKVALQLGCKWVKINTLDNKLRKLIDTSDEEFVRYYKYIGNFGNFVWLFEYVAIHELQQKGLLSADAVFIPGHCADVIAGSHLTKACVKEHNTFGYLVDALLYDSFEYFDIKQYHVRTAVKNYFKQNIGKDIVRWSAFQEFIFNNRLSHNIVNSARVYEFMGYDVMLPFWDQEFINFFRTLPFDSLNKCTFYKNFVRTQYFQPMNVDYHNTQQSTFYFYRMKLRKRIKQLLPIYIRHRYAHLEDSLGEKELVEPLLNELIAKRVYKNKRYYSSINQIMKDWYLLKVRECILE